MPTITAVMLSWNSRQYAQSCLQALLDSDRDGYSLEVIIIDNGSSEQEVVSVPSDLAEVTVIINDRNRGVAPARNQGIRRAGGEYVLLLDDDTRVSTNALATMLRVAVETGAGVVGPKLVGLDGSLQYTCRLFPTLGGKLGRRLPKGYLRRQAHLEEFRDWDHSHRREVDYVIGACQLIDRRTIADVGLLDEAIFYGPEDVDFCLRARMSGWSVLYEPLAVVEHVEQRITRARRLNRLAFLHASSLAYYFCKHRYAISRKRLYARMPGPA